MLSREVLTLNERIKLVRKHMKLTQTGFAGRIGVTRDVVASWENGRVEPPEAVIRLICREQGISYDWLRFGAEPMFVPADALLADKLECIMAGDNAFVKSALRELIDLPTEAWEQIGAFVDRLYELRRSRR
jgi:transcriptional regulator with XRE-family HTH domain